MWIEDGTLEHWQSRGVGGQARFTDAAIQTSLMLRAAFKLPLRQGEGLMNSVITLMSLTISAPDHTTVSRRAVKLPVIMASLPDGPLHVLIDSTGLEMFGAGQWIEEKHGKKSRRSWRKLHLAVDAGSGQIVACLLTEQNVDDPSQVGQLLDQIDGEIGQVTADGAYDGAPTYQTITQHGDAIKVVISPRKIAVPSDKLTLLTQRNGHPTMIATQGRLGWQEMTGYGQRALVETAMGRYKSVIGPRLRARGLAAQQTETVIGVAVLNRMDAGRWAPKIRPPPAKRRVENLGKGESRPEESSAPTPSRYET